MICHTCVYSGPAPGYPPNTVQVCTHLSILHKPNVPPEKWHGQAIELAILTCKGRGHKKS